MSHGLKFGRRKSETPEQAARGKAIAIAAAKLRRRHAKAEESLRAAVAAARNGAHVLMVSNKRRAASTHAALKLMGAGTREGDVWRIGAGAIEVRS
jgi:predicted transcriptional regulator